MPEIADGIKFRVLRVKLNNKFACYMQSIHVSLNCKGGHRLVMLPCTVTLYCDSVDGNRYRVTYHKLVTR